MNESLRKGDRIRLTKMPNDPDPLPVGATGTVELIMNPGSVRCEQIHVKWDPPNEHRSLMLLPNADEWEIIDRDPRFIISELALGIRREVEPLGFRVDTKDNTITIRKDE